MKTKILLLLLACCLLALAAWLVHAPNPAQAEDVPEKYRETVDKGLEYLAKNQSQDGHWEGDDGKHPVAMTGLVGLALLMERDPPSFRGNRTKAREPKYSANILKAAHWLMEKSQVGRDGLIFSEHPSETARYMEGHGLATLFLVGASKFETDNVRRNKLNDVLTRAVKYIAKAQSTQGGWYHTSRAEGHDFDTVLTTVIQMQALQAAEIVGVPVPGEVIQNAEEYLRKAVDRYEAAKPEQGRSRATDTAAAFACTGTSPYAIPRADDSRKKWLKYCQAEIPVGGKLKLGRDELTHYYYAQAVFNLNDGAWTGYRTPMFDHLQGSQYKDGSWPAGDAISVGQVYSTAVWCTILQLDKRSHPARRPEPLITY